MLRSFIILDASPTFDSYSCDFLYYIELSSSAGGRKTIALFFFNTLFSSKNYCF